MKGKCNSGTIANFEERKVEERKVKIDITFTILLTNHCYTIQIIVVYSTSLHRIHDGNQVITT